MYDKDGMKKAFIDDMLKLGNNKTFSESSNISFNASEAYESASYKDLSNFTISEIIDMYVSICSSSLERLMVMNSLFRRYTQYCIDMNYVKDGINHYEEVTYDILNSCVNQRLVNGTILLRNDLIKEINSFNNAADKFLVLAIYEGIGGGGLNDLVGINLSQFNNDTVKLKSGRILHISSKLTQLAVESTNEYEYVAPSGKVFKYKANDENILKDLEMTADNITDKRKVLNMYSRLRSISKQRNTKAFAYGHLVESGRLNMIVEGTIKENISLRTYLRKHKKEITERYGEIVSVKRFEIKYKEYFVDKL